ncbi:MAG: hypothetical protein FJ276_23015, partial [Planctomycetes bacterium]|nr:hypothetical protein [Planctomycetota bacterium]
DAQTACGELPSTPPPPELAGWLARMVAHGCSHAVVEVSSAALASRHIAGLEFDAAVLTNVRRDHLDLHGNATNYRRAKRRLFEHLKPGGFGVLNVDDSASCRIARDLSVPLITIGMHGDGELEARLLERCVSEQTFLMIAGEESVPVRTRTIGDEFIRCCLSAAAVGLVMGLDLMTIVRGLEAVEHVPGRLERLECGQPFGVFVDHAQTPNTLALSLRTMRQVTAGRVICVYGSPQWQASDQRAAIGSVAERGADIGIITSNDPGREAPLKIAHDILDGFRHPGRAHVIPDRAKAIQWALGEARPGDTVLITGKGDQSYQLIGERAVPFEDRDVARCWLHGSQPRLEKVGTRATIPFRPPHEWN